MEAPPHRHRRIRFPPLIRHVRPVPVFQALRRALSVFRVGPLLNPGSAFNRWRTQRALRSAARAARDPKRKRDWQNKFHLNGLTWHHLYISQDLQRIHSFLRELHRLSERPNSHMYPRSSQPRITPEIQGVTLVRLERAYTFLLDNVYNVYNFLEKNVLFPWIESGIQDGGALQRALQIFSKERDRIEDDVDIIQTRLARLVCTTGYPYTSMGPCSASRTFSATRIRREKRYQDETDSRILATAAENGGDQNAIEEISKRRRSSLHIRNGYGPDTTGFSSPTKESAGQVIRNPTISWKSAPADEIRQLSIDLQTVIEDSDRLHKTERKLLYPLIARSFPEREQTRITNVLVYSMRSALAKFMIAVYQQAVDKHGTRSQWRYYKREVPLPLRMYTPVWRSRLYDGSPLGWLRRTSVKDVARGEVTPP